MSAVVPFEPRSTVTEADRLGAHITELHSYITAATCHFLDLIREFDVHRYWAEQGFYSCAHWLNFHCGIGKNAAREKIRVAHALAARPKIREAFAEGRISYSKARAITRTADDTNEDYLLNLCKHGTAHHVEHVVAQYRRAKKFACPDFAMDQFASREVTWRYDDDGSVVISAKLPPDRGEVVLKALEKAIDVTAVTSSEGAAQRRADALADVAETYLSNSEFSGSTADRFQVVVHSRPDAGAAPYPEGSRVANIENGPNVTAVTSERIACDCSKVDVIEREHGEPLSIGRKSRVVPAAIMRALKLRDGGCRFPGCSNARHVDAHHIIHWSRGGETSLNNLVLQCRFHHVLMHEGGFSCEMTDDGEIVFFDQRERRIAENPTQRETTIEESMAYLYRRYPNTSHDACRARWYAGDEIDYDYAVSLLFPPDRGAHPEATLPRSTCPSG